LCEGPLGSLPELLRPCFTHTACLFLTLAAANRLHRFARLASQCTGRDRATGTSHAQACDPQCRQVGRGLGVPVRRPSSAAKAGVSARTVANSKWIPDRVCCRAQVRDDATYGRVGSTAAGLGEQRRGYRYASSGAERGDKAALKPAPSPTGALLCPDPGMTIWQAAECAKFVSCEVRTGSSRSHTLSANAHRVRKRQPEGGLIGFGGSPASGERSSRLSGSIDGRDANSARV
jgi:hypothetical protein